MNARRRWMAVVLFAALAGAVLAQPAERPRAQPGERRPERRGPWVPKGVNLHQDIPYVEGGHRSQRLDLYVPEDAKGPTPLIIWVHGGAWLGGDKRQCPATGITTRGYAVASINYRLSHEATWPAQIHDCKAAVRWLRAHAAEYKLDPDRFGAWGSSAGGHLVALLGTSGGVAELEGDLGSAGVSSRVQAVCDYCGPTDFLVIGKFPSHLRHDAADSPEAKLLGGPIHQNVEKARQANPIAYITADDPPFLIVHGDKDMTVPVNQSEILYDALKKAGVWAKYVPVPGGGHGVGPPGGVRTVNAFFDEHLAAKDAKETKEDKVMVDIHWHGHDTFRIVDAGKQIYFDPYKVPDGLPKADVIFITHEHRDHYSPEDVAKIVKDDTKFVAPTDVAKTIGEAAVGMKPGDEVTVDGLKVKAIAAYNIDKFRTPGVPFHPKEKNWVGYVVTLANGTTVYHAGDTDFTPEMKTVKVDVALLPVSGKYVMTAAEAVEAANAISPKVAVPMHYGGGVVGTEADAEAFKKGFKGETWILKAER